MSASDTRLKARTALAGKYWLAVLVTLIASILGGLSSSSTVNFNIDLDALEQITSWNIDEIMPLTLNIILAITSMAFLSSTVISLGRFVIGGVVELCYCDFLLKLYDRKDNGVKDLFSKFDSFGRGFVQRFLRGLYTFLWSLLFIVPGIIKGYSYAMTPFIMAEDPNISPNDAITKSRELMDGHKWDLFWLELTFIGWHLLNILTLGIGTAFLEPYVQTARAAFYREICPSKAISEIPLESPGTVTNDET